jgi:hypothetical protein
MAIEKKTIPVAPWRGLYLDGVSIPGGLSKAENIRILADGTAERRLSERTLTNTLASMQSKGTNEIFELIKNDKTRYIYADVNNSETYTSGFGAEEVASFATWTAPSGWTYGSSKWTHSSGTTALPAAGGSETLTIVAATLYKLVVDITCPVGASGTGNWAYTDTDSGYTWTTKTGATQTVWLRQWTHSSGDTVALTTANDFTPDVGASYVISIHVTHTSGTGLTVTMGGLTLGTIATSGTHTFTARYCTSTAALKFTPSSNWVGSINKTWPKAKGKLDNWCTCVKLLNPAGPTDSSNWDYSESTHVPKSMYANGAELLDNHPISWYPEVAATVSQSVAITLGGTAVGTVTTSGKYEYDVTSTNTTTLTFTPTTSWTGSINSASVKKQTQSVAATKTKVMGGTVSGTNDVEIAWTTILTDLTASDSIKSQWAQLQDRAYRVDGSNPNYWFDDATYYHALGCPAPADAPTTADTTGGSITAGDYNVYYTYVKRYSNNYTVESNPSPAAYTTVTNNAITCAVVACTEADVTHIRIYRTLYNEPGSYAYFDRQILNFNQTVTLIASDDDIRDTATTLEFDHDVPPIGKFILGAGSRLWLIDNDGTLHWSRLDEPEIMPSANFQSFDPKDGDEMMGMCPLRKHILVFKRKRFWLLDQYSESVDENGVAALAKDVGSSNYGCIATGSIQPAGTDAAIWLSQGGFMHYNGGTLRNISAGDGEVPSRIQTVINDFMLAGAESKIDSVFHSRSQCYHVNFLLRNSTDDTITSQRHFVYNLVTDTWTEDVYRNSSDAKMYELNFAIGHDSYGNECLLISYLDSTTGEVTYFYQGEYDSATITTVQEIIDSTGDGATAFTGPIYSFTDNSSNVYIITSGGTTSVWKVSSGLTKTALVSDQALTEGAGYSYDGSGAYHPVSNALRPVVDITNSVFYSCWPLFASIHSHVYAICKVGFNGTVTSIKNVTLSTTDYTAGDYFTGLALYGGNLFAAGYTVEVVLPGGTYLYKGYILKFTSPGPSQVETTYYDFYANGYTGTIGKIFMYSDDLYVQYTDTTNYTNLQIIKLTTITGEAAPSLIDTGISATTYVWGEILVVSDSKIIATVLNADSSENTTTYSIEYTAVGAWCATQVVAVFDNPSSPSPGSINISLAVNSAGEYLLAGDTDSIRIFNSDWVNQNNISTTDITNISGASYLRANEAFHILCGYSSNNAYKIYAPTIVLSDTEPTMNNNRVHIISNYNDLGMSQDKRISRAYLDSNCEYPGCGSFSLEPSYEVNYYTHVNGESSQPSGSVSMRPWYNPGHQTWTYTNSAFDSTLDQWYPMRLDVGIKGNKFRYAIRGGDLTASVSGKMRFRPPKLEVQILGKAGKDD